MSRSVTIKRPLEAVYRFWMQLESRPRFMHTAEIVEERPNDAITWRSARGSGVQHEGTVRFTAAPADRGTVVAVQVQGEGEDSSRLRDDLRRFKQIVETGEVVLSDGSLEGAGQGALKQRVAQPAAEVRR